MPRIIDAFEQFFSDDGSPLVDGWLKFNESGTNNTDKNTFADINEAIANTNPVQLDGAGRAPNIFGSGAYNVISFTDNNGVPGTQMQQFDPVGGDTSGSAFSDWDALTIYSIGSLITGSDGQLYRSLTASNQGNDPTTSPTDWEVIVLSSIWNINVSYSDNTAVIGSDGFLYISTIDSNVGNDPVSDSINWEPGVANTVKALSIVMFPVETPPDGYLECDGSAIDRVVYATLFALLGTDYGIGDGSTTFNIPDYRGNFLRSWDHGAGVDPDAAGRTDRGDGTTGDNVGTNQDQELDSHAHATNGGFTNAGGGTLTVGSDGGVGAVTASATGGNETRPINVNVILCIKY